MLHKLLLLVVLFTSSMTTAFSQTQTDGDKNSFNKNNFIIYTGYTTGFLKNLSFAPVKRYDYNAINYQIKYTRLTKKNKLVELQFDGLHAALKTNVIPEPDPPYLKYVFNLSSLREIYTNKKLGIHLGLQSQSNFSSFYDGKQYDFQQKLGLAGHINYRINSKHTIASKIVIPFVLWRTSTFEEEFYSLNKYQSVLWSTEYKYSLSSHFNLQIQYNFNYDRLQISEAFRELQYQINLGINFTF